MNQQQLAKKIGASPRTLRSWSQQKQQQWQALASEPTVSYDVAFFEALNRLAFNVAAFNARRWVTDKVQASLSISCTITFGVYDADIVTVVAARTLRNTAQVLEALKELDQLG